MATPYPTKSISAKVQALMTGKVGQTRQKGILTLAKRKNISSVDARFNQSLRIAQSQVRKGK